MTKTITVTVRNDPEWGCWIAFQGGTPEDSGRIGEGTTQEDAIADYWANVHGYENVASLLPPDYECEYWRLFDGTYVARFDTREEAVAYAEAHQYILNPFIQEA